MLRKHPAASGGVGNWPGVDMRGAGRRIKERIGCCNTRAFSCIWTSPSPRAHPLAAAGVYGPNRLLRAGAGVRPGLWTPARGLHGFEGDIWPPACQWACASARLALELRAGASAAGAVSNRTDPPRGWTRWAAASSGHFIHPGGAPRRRGAAGDDHAMRRGRTAPRPSPALMFARPPGTAGAPASHEAAIRSTPSAGTHVGTSRRCADHRRQRGCATGVTTSATGTTPVAHETNRTPACAPCWALRQLLTSEHRRWLLTRSPLQTETHADHRIPAITNKEWRNPDQLFLPWLFVPALLMLLFGIACRWTSTAPAASGWSTTTTSASSRAYVRSTSAPRKCCVRHLQGCYLRDRRRADELLSSNQLRARARARGGDPRSAALWRQLPVRPASRRQTAGRHLSQYPRARTDHGAMSAINRQPWTISPPRQPAGLHARRGAARACNQSGWRCISVPTEHFQHLGAGAWAGSCSSWIASPPFLTAAGRGARERTRLDFQSVRLQHQPGRRFCWASWRHMWRFPR